MCVFHSSQFTFMTRNQAAQPPNIIVDTKSGGNSAPDLVSKSVVAFQATFRFFSATFLRWYSASRLSLYEVLAGPAIQLSMLRRRRSHVRQLLSQRMLDDSLLRV
jgi:hypothetical protein